MSNFSKIVENTAKRLGLQDEVVLRQTEEYLRVFQSKASVKSLNDVAKTVLCLDLACNQLGQGFDKETAFKLSGLKKSAYQNSLHTVQKILELDKPLTIPELCVQLSCTTIKEDAERLLDSYAKNDNKIKDIAHPQYVAAAVYVACKLKRIKVVKPQFIALSRLKASQWKDLVNELEQFAESQGIASGNKRGKTLDENVIESQDVQIDKSSNVQEIEPYEVWKERILQEAYAAVGKNQHSEK